MIESRAPATIRLCPSGGRSPSETPSAARMKENSPIWARLAEIVRDVWRGWPKARTMARAAIDLPIMTMKTTRRTWRGLRTRIVGSNSIPTATKKSTANASWSGSASAAARWLRSDSLMTTPAKKAPSANETPKSTAAPTATPRAVARTASVKSSRDPVWATRSSSHGTTRRPTTNIRPRNAATLASVTPIAPARPAPAPAAAVPPRRPARAGSSTRTRTVKRSSTISQPTAILPSPESSAPRSSRARRSTTVLATDRQRPKTIPDPQDQPHRCATAAPRAVAAAIWNTAPGTAIPRTAIRSRGEKCRPTPNIRRMTPISASCEARAGSATNPGVKGPTRTPATR